MRDREEQAPSPRFSAARLAGRSVDELIGICRGILSDGMILQAETQYLLAWFDSNREAAESWPGSVIYPRIAAMLQDGVLDDDEQAELLDLLNETTGMGIPLPEIARSYSSALPLCEPAPTIEIPGRIFVLTGKFVQGSRSECEGVVEALGGITKSKPSKGDDYLVIGTIGSRDWIHSTHGRKIEKAVELRKTRSGIRIVAEAHWSRFL